MADFTKTITNTIAVFGGKPTNNWGTMLWGQLWAYTNLNLIRSVNKLTDNTVILSDDYSFQYEYFINLSNSVSILVDMSYESLTDSNGWNIFWGNSANAESRPFTSYNELSTNTSFVTASNSSTSWTAQ